MPKKDIGTQQEFELRNRPLFVQDFFPSTDLQTFEKMIEKDIYPQRMVFYGKPGLGKTTLAHIIASHILKLSQEERESLVLQKNTHSILNYYEADFAMNPRAEYASHVAELVQSVVSSSGIFGPQRYVFLLEEFTQLQKETQKRLIKLVSDHSRDDVFVIITTNDIHKIESSMGDRQLDIPFNLPSEPSACDFIIKIAKKEGVSLTKEEALRVYTASSGSYRSMVNNLWHYLSYGTVTSGEVDADNNAVVSRYFVTLTHVYNEVLQIHYNARKSKTPVDLSLVSDTAYNALLSAIMSLASVKKTSRNVYEAFVTFITSSLLNKKGTKRYKTLSLAYDSMVEIENLKNQYDNNLIYELLRLSEAIIRSRLRHAIELDSYSEDSWT